MKIGTVLIVCYFTINVAAAQTNVDDFQSNPESVLKEVFRAANEQDFSNLNKLCPPDNSNDGDTQKYICDIASASEKIQEEFITYFKTGKITAEIKYSSSHQGFEIAFVPFNFNYSGGASQGNETMRMVNIDGKWYLSSF